MTECNQVSFTFHPLGRREVVGRFDGGQCTWAENVLRNVEVEAVVGHMSHDLGTPITPVCSDLYTTRRDRCPQWSAA
jgi:hypothetical protein